MDIVEMEFCMGIFNNVIMEIKLDVQEIVFLI
jgi:hypothetical protein